MQRRLSGRAKLISMLVLFMSSIIGGLLFLPTHEQHAHADGGSPSINCDQQTQMTPVPIFKNGNGGVSAGGVACKVTVGAGYCLHVRSDHVLDPGNIKDCIPNSTNDGTLILVCQTFDSNPQNSVYGSAVWDGVAYQRSDTSGLTYGWVSNYYMAVSSAQTGQASAALVDCKDMNFNANLPVIPSPTTVPTSTPAPVPTQAPTATPYPYHPH